MNIYLTSGTMDFMETLRKKYKNEMMIAMHGPGNSVLLHETEGKSVFQTPRRYEVISASGPLQEQGFFAFSNIPVSDEGRPVFEHRFKSRVGPIEKEPGFVAYRLLRPIKSDTYVILTQWSGPAFFEIWKQSRTYQHLHATNESGLGLETKPHIFTSAPYVTTYKTKAEDDDEN